LIALVAEICNKVVPKLTFHKFHDDRQRKSNTLQTFQILIDVYPQIFANHKYEKRTLKVQDLPLVSAHSWHDRVLAKEYFIQEYYVLNVDKTVWPLR
jgi:hypothetical protein